MKNFKIFLLLLPLIALVVVSCNKEEFNSPDDISQEVINKVRYLGFNPDGIERVDAGFRVERDIILTHQNLEQIPADVRVPNAEQYRSFNTVNTGGNRVITVYIPQESSGGRKGGGNKSSGFSPAYESALVEAIRRFNAETLNLSFQRVSTPDADIVFTRLSNGDENQGVLVLAGFPSKSGDPYGNIVISGILQSSYGLNENGITSIMAHAMGHCIGFRHTDYFDPSVSCGGGVSVGNYEGNDKFSSKAGAEHIPGTPTGANPSSDLSWMLSCTDGGNRPFTNNDRTALNWMYVNNY